ncbi:hypothetical protein BJX61DRAFT_545355 [Aspergillus egyptiacus]|nr:hypothetical protein BJX61DRAFT_545355 [Aspergillus egyptiacus]
MPCKIKILFSAATVQQPFLSTGSLGAAPCVLGGGVLDGYARLWLDARTGVSAASLVEVTLEGELLNTLESVPWGSLIAHQGRKWLKFLRLTYTVALPDPDTLDRRYPLMVPWHFDIPNAISGVDRDIDSDHGRGGALPPSISLATESYDGAGDVWHRGKCGISYFVRARLLTRDGICHAEDRHPVLFIPTATGVPPPLCVSDFPGEYCLAASRSPSRILPFQGAPSVSICTEEPAPLHFNLDNRSAFTTIPIQLLYRSSPTPSTHYENGPNARSTSPAEVHLVVDSSLEAATVWSTLPQDAVPRLVKRDQWPPVLVKKTEVCRAQNRKLCCSTWTPTERPAAENSRKSCMCGGWRSVAKLVYTYDSEHWPVPTFSGAFTSRRYTLIVMVRLEGLGDPKFRFRVPLQITCGTSPLETSHDFGARARIRTGSEDVGPLPSYT